MSIRCYLTLYNTHHPAEKLELLDKFLEPHAIIKPIIYLSFLTCMKNMKSSGFFANVCENDCTRGIKWTPSFKFCANRLTQSGITEKNNGLGQYAD